MARVASNVTHLVPSQSEPDYDQVAAAAYPEVQRVLEAEATIKRAILAAALAGDSRRVAVIVERWLVELPVAVAAGLDDLDKLIGSSGSGGSLRTSTRTSPPRDLRRRHAP
jgi:hypothetical protein